MKTTSNPTRAAAKGFLVGLVVLLAVVYVRAESIEAKTVDSRSVTYEFDTNVNRGIEWRQVGNVGSSIFGSSAWAEDIEIGLGSDGKVYWRMKEAKRGKQ